MSTSSNIFYIMGTGLSVNDITKEEWDYLKNKHTLGFGGFPYCGIPTEFFMTFEAQNTTIENLYKCINQYKPHYDIKLEILKLYGHMDTKLLLFYNTDIERAKELSFKYIIPIIKLSSLFLPSRKGWFIDELEPPHKFKECRANTFKQPLFRFRGSLSAAINSCLILGAKEIRLVGIDLDTQMDFYMQNPDKWIPNNEVKKVFKEAILPKRLKSISNIIKTRDGFNPNEIHSTNYLYIDEKKYGSRALRPISDTIQWMDKEIREEGLSGIYITNKKSLLYKENKLTYKGIMDE